jgi:cytosolic phospholipase A2
MASKLAVTPTTQIVFKGLYAQIYDGTLTDRPAKMKESYGNIVTNPSAPTSTTECTMVYMPLLPNERAVPGYDPSMAKFSGRII